MPVYGKDHLTEIVSAQYSRVTTDTENSFDFTTDGHREGPAQSVTRKYTHTVSTRVEHKHQQHAWPHHPTWQSHPAWQSHPTWQLHSVWVHTPDRGGSP